MLVLSRKRNEAIHIGNVVISVKQIRGNKVTLGIEAPGEVRILRGELKQVDAEAVEGIVADASSTMV